MSARLAELRTMRTFIDAEIQAELDRLGEMTEITDGLIARACTLYGADVEDVRAGRRTLPNVRARHAAAWLLRRHGLSLPKIGAVLGCDHTTALYAVRKIDRTPATRALLLGLEVVA